MKDEDAKLDELLARGTLGGPHYDEILGLVLERTGVPEPRPLRRGFKWVVIPGVLLVPAAAAWLILLRPSAAPPTPKGAPGASAAFQVGCGPSAGSVCRSGDTLMLSVNAALVSGFVGAYAQRIGDPARQRIWYFPASTGAAPEVTAGSGTVVLSDGILIGPEHLPGAYRITVWISDRPFSRSEIEAAAASGTLPPRRSTLDLQVAP